MRVLEIGNVDQIRPIFERVSFSTRVLPSLIMFAATSKSIILLVLNMIIVFNFPSASWRLCSENQDYLLDSEKIHDDIENESTVNDSRQTPPNSGHIVQHETHF